MPTYIKTGFWDKKVKAPKEWLDLDLLISQNLPPIPSSIISTLGTSLYSTIPAAGPNFNTNGSIFFGENAGQNASNADNSNFLGGFSGYNATNANRSNFLGQEAGSQATNAFQSNFIGYRAGYQAVSANNSNFFGYRAGYASSSSNNSVFIGQLAGQNAIGTQSSIFIGSGVAQNVTNASSSTFLGPNAGNNSSNVSNCNFLGREAGMNSTGNNVNAFGQTAGVGNALSGMTIFSNLSLPSFVNRAAATTAITVANGAVAGNTYLYYNQTTFAIEGIRL